MLHFVHLFMILARRRGRLPGIALAVVAGAFIALAASIGGAQAQPAPQQAVDEPVQAEVRAVLSQYGRFVQHQKFGEVWVPTATPEGWHPYPPCGWVNTHQFGWYYDDKTQWGQIVHHYGRWFYDRQIGWAWDPGSEFSPGWVAWRTSPEWVGWAPMPPDAAFQEMSADQFNSSDQWLFMATEKFAKGCEPAAVAPRAQVPVLLQQTKWVTALEFVDGIAIIVLPSYILGPFVTVHAGFNPWPAWFLVQAIINANFVWNNTLIFNVAQVCTPNNPH